MDVTNRSAWTRYRSTSGWTRRVWDLGQQLRPASITAGQLFVVGTPTHDAWHVAAHLDDEATFSSVSALRPTLLRWQPPASGPAHLRVSVDALRDSAHGRAVLIFAPDALAENELERLADARRAGAMLLAVSAAHETAAELDELAHDCAIIDGPAGAASFENSLQDMGFAGHLVTVSAGTAAAPRRRFALLGR
ncbi:MAG TPA: hypothetical protein VHX15_09735 [Frankiaceae bacterium]|jgi:hypothetical protein|nr:hypothetical protein [Frankiaceae bacterium]